MYSQTKTSAILEGYRLSVEPSERYGGCLIMTGNFFSGEVILYNVNRHFAYYSGGKHDNLHSDSKLDCRTTLSYAEPKGFIKNGARVEAINGGFEVSSTIFDTPPGTVCFFDTSGWPKMWSQGKGITLAVKRMAGTFMVFDPKGTRPTGARTKGDGTDVFMVATQRNVPPRWDRSVLVQVTADNVLDEYASREDVQHDRVWDWKLYAETGRPISAREALRIMSNG